MKKKIVALLVSSSLLFGGFDLANYVGGFSNSTPPSSTWSLKNGTLLSGGNYEYRYAFSGNMKPLFAAKAPSVKVGCGSISIDGGFLAYLGLDDIETQFTDASAAFAFGFMSALELTMPEIAAVIHKLQQWARMLQQLLAGACEAGKNQGGALFKDLWASWGNDTQTFLGVTSNPNYKASKFEQTINDLWPGSGGETSSVAEGKKKDTVKKVMNAAGGSSMLLSFFGNYMPSRPESADLNSALVVFDAKLSTFLGEKKLGDKDLDMSSSEAAFNEKKDLYLLIKILFGDVYASDSSISYIKRYFNADGTTNPNALKQDVKLGVFGGSDNDLVIGPGFLKGSPWSPEEVADALMYGFNKISTDGSNKLTVADNKLLFIDAKISTGASGSAETREGNLSVTVTDEDTGGEDENSSILTLKTLLIQDDKDGEFEVEFNGFVDGSLEAIQAKVKGDNSFDWTTIKVPNAVAAMGKYVKTLRLLYKKNNSNLVVDTLIQQLAKLNAYYVADAFLGKTESLIRYHKNNAKVTLSKDSNRMLRDNLDKLSVRIKKIKKALAGKIPKLSSMPTVNADFDMLEKQIKEDIGRVIGE